jgi:hypothetical protein
MTAGNACPSFWPTAIGGRCDGERIRALTNDRMTRRGALSLALGALASAAGVSEATMRGKVFCCLGVAFGTTVSITLELEATDERMALLITQERIALRKPRLMITLDSLARGLAADRVAAALRRTGIVNALFDTDVSVFAHTGLLADALSTAVFLLVPSEALRLLKSYGAEALLVDKAGTVTQT